MRQINYRGDTTAQYDPETGLGVIGKVVGPNVNGEWFRIVTARYDRATGITHCDAEALQHPEYVLNSLEGQTEEPTP